MQNREWARGLSQDDFAREFQRRNPHGDVIPAVIEWVDGHEPVYHGIPDIPPESYTQDGPGPTEQETHLVQEYKPLPKGTVKGVFPCRGCGKEFGIALARSGHERGCKAVVKKEVVHAGT